MSKTRKQPKRKESADSAALESTNGPDLVTTPPADNAPGHKRAERRRALNDDLRREIQALRETVAEMLGNFKLNVDAELAVLVAAVSGQNGQEEGKWLSASTAEEMLEQIRELEIKPAKGRAKDLQRVQKLVDGLIEQLPSGK
jgi:hypothetical protein